jgi:ferric-dicitrate binding protein FerR (iron transport regulator)
MSPRPHEDCARAAELEAALDGRLDTAAEAEVLAHARACLSCAALERSLRSLRERSRSLPGAAPDPAAAQRVRAEVLAGAGRAGRGLSTPVRRALAVAAAVTLALLGGAAIARRRPAPPRTDGGIELAGVGMLRPERGAVYRVERVGADTRIGLTEGTIHLAVVRRRRSERFVVALGDAEVEVRGTRFAVDAHEGHLRRVRVTEGLVAVRRQGLAERFVAAGGTLEVTEAPAPAPGAAALPPTESLPPTEPLAPDAPSAPALRVEAARPASAAALTASRDFRAGALAYVRGEPAAAATALQRFLAAAPARDPRREDARYVLVLALDASHEAAAEGAARAYLAEFPRGLRRAEVTVRLTRRLAARGACDAAASVALGMPENADGALRAQVAHGLARCAGTPGE